MEDKKVYLQIIQEPICRMSTMSSIIKGFAATIVSGISLISYENTKWEILLLSLLPVLSFAALDVYYLILERKYRYLYDQVRRDQHAIDYSMSLTHNKDEISAAKARIINCIMSPSIFLFYPILILVLIIVFFLKWGNIV